ncbi:hypothetical protein HID58_048038 [Brassica napus]|uniref:Uncharacterized protein n=1 Tax=Brassica napus TaxID=3708 RepID=A0ABQ8B0Y8_BRANA|nr:hypothetical protein HID58_048038 [Brassica napus]
MSGYETLDQIIRQHYNLSQHTPIVVSYRLASAKLDAQEGMWLLHRVSLEMAFADSFLADQNRSNPPTMMMRWWKVVKGMLTGIANDVVGHIAQEEAPPIFWDVRMDLLNYPEHANTHGPTGERIENGMMFWEGVANERFAAEG